jgi:CheY-like chemotaxis protein
MTGNPLRVLVVDDDAAVAAYLVDCLTFGGCAVVTAADASTALVKLRADVYDVVLCDITMPGLDGVGFYRKLAESRPDLLPRLVFISGRPASEVKALFPGRHVRIVEKPVPVRTMTALVEEWRLARAAG